MTSRMNAMFGSRGVQDELDRVFVTRDERAPWYGR